MANFSQKEMDQLRTQMYSGFLTKSVPRYEWRGAGKDGRSRRQTGYSQVTNYDAYNDGLWGRAARAVGIKNVDNSDEIRRIYDYIGGYKPPTPKAQAAPAPVANYRPTSLPSTAAPAAPDYSKYQAQVASLGSALSGLQSQLKANSAAYAKSIADQQKNFAGQFANQTASFNNLFATQQAGFNKNLADQSAAFKQEIADQTTKYDNNMSALRNSLSETLSNKAQPVMGVKSGAYGQQTAAMQRQGIKGTFGRSGLRIKGIKDNSLNI